MTMVKSDLGKLLKLSASERRRIMGNMKLSGIKRRQVVEALKNGARVLWNAK